MRRNKWFVYVLECANGRLYTGITTDLARRFGEHGTRKGAMFTRLNRPSHLLGARRCNNRAEASKLEWTMKQLTPGKKRAAVAQWPMIKDLPAIKALPQAGKKRP